MNPPPIILASITRRFCAKLIDCLIVLSIWLAVRFAAEAFATHVGPLPLKNGELLANLLAFTWFLLADALPHGQSPGKRLLDIAAVDKKTFKGCSLSQAFTRNAGALIVFDWIWIFLEGRSRLGDLYAKTIVIQTGKLSHKVRSFSDVYHGGKPG